MPTTLPDLVKTEAVIEHEYRAFEAKSAGQIKEVARDLLDYSQMPDTDMEICMSLQVVTGLARGEGLWEILPAKARREQIDRMEALSDDLYPSLRIYLFDALTHYSVPLTVFRPLRAAIYLGQDVLRVQYHRTYPHPNAPFRPAHPRRRGAGGVGAQLSQGSAERDSLASV